MFSKGKIRFHRRLDIRLAAWFTLTFLTIIIIIFGFLHYRLRHNVLKEIDRMLADEAYEIVTQIGSDKDRIPETLRIYENSISNRRYYRIAFRVLDRQGTPLYTSRILKGFSFPKAASHQRKDSFYITESVKIPYKSTRFRLCTYFYQEASDPQYILQVVTYPRLMKKNMQNFRRNLGTAFLLAFLFGSFGGWFLSRKNLRPIEKITEKTREITVSNLRERLPLQGTGDELDQLAQTINQMFERLEASFQTLSQFTADAAHELRTPITALKGEIEVLLCKKRSTEEYREALTHNLERLDFLTRIVNDLLLLSKWDETGEGLQFETVNLSELLEELWDAFNLVAAQRKIEFTFNKMGQVFIPGDSLTLKRLFSNLIDNAVKYTPDGGKIDLLVQPEMDRARITLKDTGIGIPDKDLPHIFDRFYRVDKSRSRQAGGTGLGLSICQWIVNAHHGTIDVESKHHQGTTLTVILPTKLA